MGEVVGIGLLAKANPRPHRCYGHVVLHNEKTSQSLQSLQKKLTLFKFNLGKEQNIGIL